MTITIKFTHRYTWGSSGNNSSNRPYSDILISGPNGSYNLFALVDTGADYTQIDDSFARSLGISLTDHHASPHNVSYGNGGSLATTLVDNVEIEVEGNRITTPVIFGTFGQGVPPILGRISIVSAIELGIDSTGWLFR